MGIKYKIRNSGGVEDILNLELNIAFPKLVSPVITPALSVTTDILNDKSEIIPVKRTPVDM